MSSALTLSNVSVNHTLTDCVLVGSLEMYPTPSDPEPYSVREYSRKDPVEGENEKILSEPNSVPQRTNDPPIIVVVRAYGLASRVGIVHSWNVLLLGSKCAILLP